MVQKIVRLSEEVINKIAAGEAVENPAAIAKELIENSLDAGALHIDISIEEGGCGMLKVEDDGCGMSPEDALLSLERHATSKIRTESDLFSLATMGFRGEALAAIAAVSRFELRTSDGETGTRIEVHGGEKLRLEPCARNRGTSASIRDLFFNTPARKKFLKSSSANTAALVRVVETLAMAHWEVSFSLTSDQKTILIAEPQDKRKRIETLLSPMPHEASASGIWGLFASPEESRSDRRGQYLFINKRPVFSPLISRAVKMGYGTRISEHSHPTFVLFLEVAPGLVDVNVHPQKKEVRFADEGKIFRFVERTVTSAFEKPIPTFSKTLAFPQSLFSLTNTSSSPPPSSPQMEATSLSFDFATTMRPLAVVEGYFFLQTEELLLIDLRKAHARVLYEALKEKKEAAQALLWPIEVAVEDEEIGEELQAMGIECRLIGKKTLAIDALPPLLEAADFPDFLRAWESGKKLDVATSCYTKRSRRKFNTDEACFLWRQLLKCRETLFDPSGRKIWERIDAGKLQKILEGP